MPVAAPDSLIPFAGWPPIEYVVGIPPLDLRWDTKIRPVTIMWTIPVPPFTICVTADPAPLPAPPPTGPGPQFYSIADSTAFTRRKRKAAAVQLDKALASSHEKERPEQQPEPVSPALPSDETFLSVWRRKFRA